MNQLRRAAVLGLIGLFMPACSPPGGGNGNGNGNGNNNGSVKVPDGFPAAREVNFDEANRLIVDGEITDTDEVALFALGPLTLGDHVNVQCIAVSGSSLDPMSALFDADGFRVFWNDDINPSTANFDSAFDGFIRHDSEGYFLAVASTSFFDTTGAFRCTVLLQPRIGVVPLVGQTVVLRWDDAPGVRVSGILYGDLPAFDAANINPDFAGGTDEIRAIVETVVREDFAPYDVTILNSDDEAPEGNFTTVFFGVSSTMSIFGIADEVDFYNRNDMDNGIVFLSAFGDITASAKATAQAIANVVSHEIGHTLGLMHTNDVTTLMDTTGADVTLLEDQSFGTADIVDFPIGRQNSPLLLEETVGRAMAAGKALDPADGQYRCGTCGATLAQINGNDE